MKKLFLLLVAIGSNLSAQTIQTEGRESHVYAYAFKTAKDGRQISLIYEFENKRNFTLFVRGNYWTKDRRENWGTYAPGFYEVVESRLTNRGGGLGIGARAYYFEEELYSGPFVGVAFDYNEFEWEQTRVQYGTQGTFPQTITSSHSRNMILTFQLGYAVRYRNIVLEPIYTVGSYGDSGNLPNEGGFSFVSFSAGIIF